MSDPNERRPIWGWEGSGPQLFNAEPIPSDKLTPLHPHVELRLRDDQRATAKVLVRTVAMVTAATETNARAVLKAREIGMSWDTIGLCVNMTAEGARRKWRSVHE